MPYALLDLGEVFVTSETMLRGTGNEYLWVPVRAALITCSGKRVLFDTGCGEGDAPAGLLTRRSLRQTLNVQLAKHGIGLGEIDMVVLSHLHEDHCGGAYRFTDIPVFVPEEELKLHRQEVPQLNYISLSAGEEPELCPGLKVLSFPGHTENLLGLALEEADGKYLFASDALYTPLHMGPPVRYSGYPWSDEVYRLSAERILAMVEDGWQIVWNHWPIPELIGR